MNRPFPDVVGLVPNAGASTAIGGAPLPLLLTGEAGGETFLDRAIASLRQAGISRVLVEVAHASGPVSARARRAGADLVPFPARADSLLPGTVVAVMSPVFPMVQPGTLAALLAVLSPGPGDPVGWPAGIERIVPRLEPPSGDSGDGEVAPCLVRSPLPPAGSLLRTSGGPGLLSVPVADAGIHLRVDTLPTYRRHFPSAYRRRFQKW